MARPSSAPKTPRKQADSDKGSKDDESSDRVTTAVRFPRDIHARLHEAAKERELSANFLVVRAVQEFLDRLIPADEIKLTRD